MQPNLTKKKSRIYKASFVASLCFIISACASPMKVSYVSREEIKTNAFFTSEQPRYIEKKPMSLGALRITRKDAAEGEMGQVFMLQRKKSVYMAETKIMDTGKKRYFLSFGIDYKSRTPAAGFRMEF